MEVTMDKLLHIKPKHPTNIGGEALILIRCY
jgi:hypothetical protein